MSARAKVDGARAAVIGNGANAQVAAHLLLKSGYAVSLFPDGDSSGDDDIGWVAPRIERALRLDGLKVDAPDPWAAAALPQGGRLELWRDMGRSVESIRRVSPADAQKWPPFCERMGRLASFLERLYLAPPPDPLGLRFALRARLLGRQGLVDLMRLLPMSVAELLDDWFENDALKGLLGAAGVMHLQQGPRSGGTAFRFLHHHVGSPPGVFRPPRSNLRQALAGMPGLDIRTARVDSVAVREGRARGVVLEDGEQVETALVVCGAHPRRTLLELVDPVWLDPELVHGLRHLRDRPVAARVTLQLDRAPGFGALVHAPSLDYLERAYDDSKYGRMSQRPHIEAHCHERRVDAHVQYVPAGADIRALGDVVAATLSESLGDAVIESVEVAPSQQSHQIELALDQALWMRPLPQLAHYRTPIKGLWLCGAAMHPGGAIAGAAGYNCARAALATRP